MSFAGYPLLVGPNLVGVIGLFSRHRLSPAEFDLIATVADAVAAGADRLQADQRARSALRALHEIGRTLVAELDLERAVQIVTDAATDNIGAAFGAFFYNVTNDNGESFTLYTLSGAPRSAFEQFPLPRNTAVFAPTFNGERTVRFDDVTARPEFGQNDTYHGMPPGHLPVRSYLAVPVTGRDAEVLGGLFFAHPEPGQFTQADEELVEGIAGYASVAITNAREYRREQQIVLTLQQAVLPTIREHPGVEIAVRYLPAALRAEVGGDWYDTTPLPDGRIAITVGDVAGHSVRAAARMGAVRHVLGAHVLREGEPAAALYELDRYLTATGQLGLVTAVQALLDPETLSLDVARSGHLPPLILPPDGPAFFLPGDPGPPLGVGLITALPETHRVTLKPGSSVVFFTDGLIERRGVLIDDRLEELQSLLSGQGSLGADDLCQVMVEGLVDPTGAKDDIAMLVLKTTTAIRLPRGGDGMLRA